MTDHPYATGNTLTPGEIHEDDPQRNEEYCPRCDQKVEPMGRAKECPLCGEDL